MCAKIERMVRRNRDRSRALRLLEYEHDENCMSDWPVLSRPRLAAFEVSTEVPGRWVTGRAFGAVSDHAALVVDMQTFQNPGCGVWEDEHQIAPAPWADTSE